jgi:adenosylmethionine-8-amino-7-oxononanoate aminotransferase
MNVHRSATTIRKNSPSLYAFWMPFTANRQFKQAPRLLAAAEGMQYTPTTDAGSSTGRPE